jgi:hypothetical protein
MVILTNDIIVIEKDVFQHEKNSMSYENNKYKLKLEELFKNNECFINTVYKYSPGKNTNGGWNSSGKSYDTKDINRGPRKKLFASDTPLKPIEKILKSIKTFINILNKSNQSIIEVKLIKIMLNTTDEEKNCILKSFVHLCTLHSPYLETFVNIINNVFHCKDVEIYGKELCQRFVLDLPEYISSMENLDYSNYDEFCMFNKKKEILYNLLYIIVHLLQNCNDELICLSNNIIDIIILFFDSKKINISDFVIDLIIYAYKLVNNIRVIEILDCKYNDASIKSKFRIEDFRKEIKHGMHFT